MRQPDRCQGKKPDGEVRSDFVTDFINDYLEPFITRVSFNSHELVDAVRHFVLHFPSLGGMNSRLKQRFKFWFEFKNVFVICFIVSPFVCLFACFFFFGPS